MYTLILAFILVLPLFIFFKEADKRDLPFGLIALFVITSLLVISLSSELESQNNEDKEIEVIE